MLDFFRQPLQKTPSENSALWIHCECCPESLVWSSKLVPTDSIVLLKSNGTFVPRSNPYFKVIIERAVQEEKVSQIILSAHQNCKCIQAVLGEKRHSQHPVSNWEQQLRQMKEGYIEGLKTMSRKGQQRFLLNLNLQKQAQKLSNYKAVRLHQLATSFVVFGMPGEHKTVAVHEPKYQNN